MIVQPLSQSSGATKSTTTTSSRVVQPLTTQPIVAQKPTAPVKTQPIPPVIKITPNQTNIFQNAQNEVQKLIKVGAGTVLSFVQPKQQIKSPVPKDQVINKSVAQQQPQATQILKITPDQKKLTPLQLGQVRPSSAQMNITPKSIEAQKQTVQKGTKFITDLKNTQTFQVMEDLKIDPLQFKANPKKAISGFLDTVKESLKEEQKRINDFIKVDKNKKASQSEILGAKLSVLSGGANVVFSPLTGFFKAAEEIPVIATLSKVISLPFTAAGEVSTEISNKVIDALPISGKVKNDLKAPFGELAALTSQLLVGKIAEVSPKKRAELVNKYGIEDANTIIKKARELSKEKMGRSRMDTVLPDGEYTPQQVMGKVIANGLENTPEGKTLVKTAVEAQERGESVQVKNTPEVIQTFEQNVQDYRSFGGYTAGKSTENAALRDIAAIVDKPEVKAHTQEQVTKAIENGEMEINDDGTITLYRGGKPSSKNSLMSATYDKTVAQRFADNAGGVLSEIKVKPEDIKTFIGKAEKEVLLKNEQPKAKVAEAGLGDVYKGKEFTFMRNTEKSPKMGNRFGQDIEPAGKYMTLADEGQTYFPPGFETGKVKFENPLVINWGEGYQSGKNWKNVLSQKYGGKKGKALSQAIAKDGYDGIITLDGGKPSEVVSLSEFSVAQPSISDVKPKTEIPKVEVKPKTDTEFTSRVFERMKAENPDILTGDLKVEQMKLMKDAEKAVDLIAKDKQKAYNIAMNKEASSDVTSTNVNIALAEQALKEGNTELYAKLITNRSLAQTRRGQEIVAEKGSISDNSTSTYVKKLLSARLEEVGKNYLGDLKDVIRKTDKDSATKVIDREVAKVEKKIASKKLNMKDALSLLDRLACV